MWVVGDGTGLQQLRVSRSRKKEISVGIFVKANKSLFCLLVGPRDCSVWSESPGSASFLFYIRESLKMSQIAGHSRCLRRKEGGAPIYLSFMCILFIQGLKVFTVVCPF